MTDIDRYYFDEQAADRVCRFFETQLYHWKGEHAGKPFTLLPWQRKILRDVFGWKRKADNTRRYHTIYCELPRKQGKTFWVSGLLVYLFCADGEAGAEVYAAACTTAQSTIALDNCKRMVAASPVLRKRITTYRYHLEHTASNSILKALSGESVGSHGRNIHGLSIDECHEWRSPASRELYEALTTSFGARRNHLTAIITTAGHGGDMTLCRELHDKATRYIASEIGPDDPSFDDTFYPTIYAAAPADPWDQPDTWSRANPSLGTTVPIEYLERECAKAKESPANENTFRRLYLNQWTEQATRWLSLDQWDNATAPVEADALDGQPCTLGIDLSQSYDLAAAVQVVPQADTWIVRPRIYIPIETAKRRSRDEGIPFMEWINDGYLIGTPGSTVDYDRIEADILEIAASNSITECAFDPYNATALTNHLEQSGITTVPVFQTYLAMSAAAKELERRLIAGEIILDDNPVFRWTASNVEIETDKHGNIRPVKQRSKNRYAGTKQFNIDPIVATIIAISRAMLRVEDQGEFNAGNAIQFI